MARRPIVTAPVDPALLAELDDLAITKFTIQARIDARTAKFEAEQQAAIAANAAAERADQAELAEADEILWRLIHARRGELIDPGRESFTAGVAVYKFANFPAKRKVLKPAEVLKKARKFHILKWVGRPVRKWELVSDMFLAFFDEMNEKLKAQFAPHVQETPAWRKLSITPNATFPVDISRDRLTLEPLTSLRFVDEKGEILNPQPTIKKEVDGEES